MFPRLFGFLALVALVGCRAPVQHGLDERDANEVTTALVRHGFDARKVPEKGKKPTWSIEVEESATADALRVLTELKLPRAHGLTTREVVAQAGLVESASAERLKQLEAQEGDLEQALETMDGVASASVELVVPPPPRPGQIAIPSKAAVLVRVEPEALDRLQQQRAELRALVAAGVDGLKAEDVVLVVDTATTRASVEVTPPAPTLRPLVVSLSLATSLLSVAVVVITFRKKRGAAREPAPARASNSAAPASPAAARPVVAASVQRKAAPAHAS